MARAGGHAHQCVQLGHDRPRCRAKPRGNDQNSQAGRSGLSHKSSEPRYRKIRTLGRIALAAKYPRDAAHSTTSDNRMYVAAVSESPIPVPSAT